MAHAIHKDFSHSARRLWCALILITTSLITGVLPAHAQTPTANKEYQVKAAYLLNFAQFIQWPAASFSGPDAPIVVGVLGDDPFGTMLEETFEDESIDGRKLIVKRAKKIDDLKSCHLLFISKSEKDRVPDILAGLRDASIVTIGEVDQFSQRGGIVNFVMDNGKVRFEINADAAQHKGLKINAQLLKRAKVITSGTPKERS